MTNTSLTDPPITDTAADAVLDTAQFRAHRGRWAVAGIATAALVGVGVLGVGVLGIGLFSSTEPITDSVSGVREIVVDIGAGPVTLTGTTDTAVGIQTISHGLFSANAGHVLADGVLTIRADGWGLNSHTEEILAVPAGIPVYVHTGAGDVTALDLDVPRFSMDAGASTADLSFRNAPESIFVDAGAAGIDIRLPNAEYDLTANASIGSEEISIDHHSGSSRSLHAETFFGGITVSPR
jgi:hypothetical protein